MKRSSILVAIAILAMFLASLAATGCTPATSHIPAANAAPTKPVCATSPITVWVDDEVPCDVTGDQVLNVAGIDQPRCDDLGGHWVGDGIELCQDVDK